MDGIELDIIYENDKTEIKRKSGIKYPLSECDVDSITFYNINCIGPYEDDQDEYNAKYSYIFSNGDKFICVLTYEELKQKLSEWKPSENIQR